MSDKETVEKKKKTQNKGSLENLCVGRHIG